MPSKLHRARLIAIEQRRWFTAGADVSLTANTHVQISDVELWGRRKARTWKGCCSADGCWAKKIVGSAVGERFIWRQRAMTPPLVSLSRDNQWALGWITDGKTDQRPWQHLLVGMAEMRFSICGWEELQQQPGCEELGLSSWRSWESPNIMGS